MTQFFIIIHCHRSQESIILQELEKIHEILKVDHRIGSFEIIRNLAVSIDNDISDRFQMLNQLSH